jgi:hypothetical protein
MLEMCWKCAGNVLEMEIHVYPGQDFDATVFDSLSAKLLSM